MSYNVTGFALKKLDGFTLPYAKLLEMTDGDVTVNDGNLLFDEFYPSYVEIRGTLDGDRLNVTHLHYSGEGSGTYWDEFENLLKQSTGTLKARIVWEGGDTVEVVTIENGVITREEL